MRRREPAAVERILRGLPQWFGVESAIAAYVDEELSRHVLELAQGLLGRHAGGAWSRRAAAPAAALIG